MAGKHCRVAFTDIHGIRHSVELQAESLFEAAVLGLRALKKSDWVSAVSPGTKLEIQVLEPAAVHILMVAQLTRWLDGGARTPAEALKKQQLRAVLGAAGEPLNRT